MRTLNGDRRNAGEQTIMKVRQDKRRGGGGGVAIIYAFQKICW
jgi:hypothetical protein